MKHRSPLRPISLLLAIVGLFLASAPASLAAPQESTRTLKWDRQAGVTRYRLQVSRDAQFKDVILDTRVTGDEYVVRDLTPGRYYWRVAASDYQTLDFQKPVVFEITAAGGTPVVDRSRVGWCTCEQAPPKQTAP